MNTDTAMVLFLFYVVVGLAISLIAAEVASGGRGTWCWGLLGPVGWIVAGLRGVHLRLEDAFPAARSAPEPEVRYHAAPRVGGAARRRRREKARLAMHDRESDEAADFSVTETEPTIDESGPEDDPPALTQ